jgi:hypothetical protein
VRKTLRTLKEAEEFEPMNALPKHMASSPFKCAPNST